MPGGGKVEFPRAKVTAIEPLKQSLMPEDFSKRLNREQQEDILTFLLVNPIEPAPLVRTNPPPPPARSRAEIAPFLPIAAASEHRNPSKPLRILLSSGVKDHGVDEHDYPLWVSRWSKLLPLANQVSVETCQGFQRSSNWRRPMSPFSIPTMRDGTRRRSRCSIPIKSEVEAWCILHWGIEGGAHPVPLADRVGLAFSFSKFRHGPLDIVFNDAKHPITRGFQRLSFMTKATGH
jgi:hypothetical protein